MRKAFTLIELIVALGLLGMMLMFASVIFRVSIDAQRMAMANSEIMQKLRVITEQLDADFRGMLASYGGQISFHKDKYGSTTEVRSDSIAFFANGDFQSTGQYGGETIVGNVASILYGPPDPNSYGRRPAGPDRLLLRRQTILAPRGSNGTTNTASENAIRAASNWKGEYFCTSLEQWRLSLPYASQGDWAKRPLIDPNKLQTYLPMYLAKGVDDFTIDYLPGDKDWQVGRMPWYPSTDPNSTPAKWITMSVPPRAIKFEFTLYDSRGIIKKGRTFSHIVLLGG
jgi:prepilin-type N-terminal cleavage/methylation domain-containing protein